MLGTKFRPITIIAVVVAYIITLRQERWTILCFLQSFIGAWLAAFSCWALWATQLYPKLFSPLRHLPEPKGNSFWHGQFKKISDEPGGAPMVEWVHTVPNEGVIKYKGFFNRERLLPVSPKALAEVLVTKNYDFAKPAQMRTTIGRILGIGILLAEGDEHKAQRRNLNPAFAFRHVKDLYPIFWAKSREAVEAMTTKVLQDSDRAHQQGKGSNGTATQSTPTDDDIANAQLPPGTAVMEVGQWASRATLDIIGVAGLGRDFGAIRDPDSQLISTYHSLFKPSRQAQILGLLHEVIPGWIITRLPMRRNNDIHQAAKFIRSVCRDMVREQKEKLTAGKDEKGSQDKNILSVALRSGGFTDDNLVDQLMTFLAAGHETTATAMTWAIYMLSRYPEVQDRLREEIRSRLPSPESGEGVTSSDIDSMPYLNAVCNEVLRYYGPVPLTIREAARDTSILGNFVPKGTRIFIGIWAINKSKELWGPDADQFKPERWLDDEKTATATATGGSTENADGSESDNQRGGAKKAASGGASSNYSFMTFLHGPRSCIGSGFAKAEFAVLLAAWVGRFQFRLRHDEEHDEAKVVIKGGVTSRPAKGMHVKATVLEGW
ncbi:hypothetical protein PpBr36_05308 [Pyricularia pennisetigena]|uniref:hypothetical protein n=1 Tax=Pyricularia pennisetigena TaxID=1578925 RepID=UPI00114F56A1|nr:hypothetical protein PpBr36_05308 [Pyricularia pennisetigena]TLS26501.1 hypothetical protein PpBr36_05308 [Pyricularia pennisetigena]